MPTYGLGYRRPPHYDVSSSGSSLSDDEKQRYINDSLKSCATCPISQGVPEPLSFDRIINGGTCPVRPS